MKISAFAQYQNRMRVHNFREYKIRSYTLLHYEQDLRNLHVKIIDNNIIYHNLIFAMLKQRIKNYENITRTSENVLSKNKSLS